MRSIINAHAKMSAMTYNHRDGIKTKKTANKTWLLLPIIGLIAGLYLLVNALSPGLTTPFDPSPDATAKKLQHAKPSLDEDRLYIPQINVDVAIVTGSSEAVLERGAWHRKPENGDPAGGGNFVLSAHRFNLGMTPNQTRAKSPFYHIDKLNEGDQIYADHKGTRYAYTVTKRYKVERTATEIEQRSEGNKLTLYSCDLRGEKAGREVVEAEQVGTITWKDGAPKLKAHNSDS